MNVEEAMIMKYGGEEQVETGRERGREVTI